MILAVPCRHFCWPLKLAKAYVTHWMGSFWVQMKANVELRASCQIRSVLVKLFKHHCVLNVSILLFINISNCDMCCCLRCSMWYICDLNRIAFTKALFITNIVAQQLALQNDSRVLLSTWQFLVPSHYLKKIFPTFIYLKINNV